MAVFVWTGATSAVPTVGSNWSVGGVAQASPPTSADDVQLGSGTGATNNPMTFATSSTLSCRSFDCTGYTGTLSAVSGASQLNIGTSTPGPSNLALKFVPLMTTTFSGFIINFVSTSATQQNIITAGKSLNSTNINGVGSNYLFNDALTTTVAFTWTAGSFDTGGFSMTTGTLVSTGAGAGVMTIGATTTWTLTTTNTPINLTGTNKTASIHASSTLNVSAGVNAGSFGGYTWGNVVSNAAGIMQLAALICVNYTRTGTTAKTDLLNITSTVYCSGTFTCTGNSTANRIGLQSSVVGTTRYIQAATFNITNTDIMDIITVLPDGSTITSDSFNRANGSLGTTDAATGGSALAWTANSGTWAIASNAVTVATGFATVDLSTQDHAVYSKLNSTGGYFGVVARYVDVDNYVAVRQTFGTAFCTIIVRVGAINILNTSLNLGWSNNATIGLRVQGNSVIVLVDGVIKYANMFATLPTGTKAGLYALSSPGTFDDFKANSLTSVTGTSLGDGLGNAGFTPTVNSGTSNGGGGVNRYWIGNSGLSSDTSHWSTTSGGSGGASIPLPQDDVYVDVNSFSLTNQRLQFDMPRTARNIDTTGTNRTGTTIGGSSGMNNAVYGNLSIYGTTIIDGNSTGGWTFAGRNGNYTIHSNGLHYGALAFNAPGAIYTALDDMKESVSNKTITFNYGSFYANNFNIGAQTFTVASTFTLLQGGTGTWEIQLASSGIGWTNSAPAANLQMQNATIYVLNAAGQVNIVGGTATYGVIQNTAAPTTTGNSPGLGLNSSMEIYQLLMSPGKILSISTGSIPKIHNGLPSGVNFGYQYFNSNAGSYVSVPDSVPTSFTGDFDIRLKIAAEAYGQTNISFTGKQTSGSAGFAWGLSTNAASKQPTLQTSLNGTTILTATSTAAIPTADGADMWLRVTRRASDGRIQFFTSSDPSNDPSVPTWTQLGSDRTGAVGTLFDSPASILIGALNTSNSPVYNGKFYRAQYRDNILNNGTGIVLDVDFTTKTFGANTLTDLSTNAATVTINGAFAQAGDGRIAVNGATPGTTATVTLVGAPPVMDYQVIQDLTSTIPYKYYAGANSILVSNTTNIINTTLPTQLYIKQAANPGVVTGTSITATLSNPAVAGNALVAMWESVSDPSTITPPSGYTQAVFKVQGTSSYLYVWWKIATGGETTIPISWVTTRGVQEHAYEIAGFTGTPTLDVTDSNGGASATSSSTGSGATNTAFPAIAIGAVSGNGGMGASVGVPTNGFQEDYTTVQGTSAGLKVAAKPLLSTGSQSTTFTWTTSRVTASVLLVLIDVPLVSTNTGNWFPFF